MDGVQVVKPDVCCPGPSRRRWLERLVTPLGEGPVGRLIVCVLLLTVVAGCVGDDGGASPATSSSGRTVQTRAPHDGTLATYRGAGFTVGYPKSWKKVSGHEVVPGAAFEVGVKSRDGRGMESSFDVLVNEDIPFPLARIVDDFVAFSRASTDFQLISRKKIELDGAEAWEIRKRYKTPQGQEVAQADLFTKTPGGRVVDIRIILLGNLYDTGQTLISSIGSSFRFASS